MQVIPVIDLLHGQVVRGVAGERHRYQPIQSKLCAGSAPGVVARALIDRFPCRQMYVADLDAIAAREPNWEAYSAIAAAGVGLILDGGLRSVEQAAEFTARMQPIQLTSRIVVGLETIRDLNDLPQFVRAVGQARAVFSLDLRHGEPLSDDPAIRRTDSLALARLAIEAGFASLIVLDLAAVGVGSGVPTLELCRTIHGRHPSVELISGGGVRGPEDLREMVVSGCQSALVASALHDGRLTAVDVLLSLPQHD
ncbi:MAG: hypothetical protein KDA71_02820 [Planctomycetales bacterium]|nr:hypothetical protein [Planctomycetales bacterium]